MNRSLPRTSAKRRPKRCRTFDLFLLLLWYLRPLARATESAHVISIWDGLALDQESAAYDGIDQEAEFLREQEDHSSEPASSGPTEEPIDNAVEDGGKASDAKPPEVQPQKRRVARLKQNLLFETTNATGWTAALERAKQTDADVLCLQEHRTPLGLIAERSQQLKKLGWKSTWSPAIETADPESPDGRCTSGGVAVLVRKYLDSHRP